MSDLRSDSKSRSDFSDMSVDSCLTKLTNRYIEVESHEKWGMTGFLFHKKCKDKDCIYYKCNPKALVTLIHAGLNTNRLTALERCFRNNP
jgi:hypothetical protein